MDEIVDIVVVNAVVIAATSALFRWDERRMTDAQRARAWPAATRGVVVLSPFWFSALWMVGVPLHFMRTRRSARGVFEGMLWTFVVFGLVALVAFALDWAMAE